MDAWRGGGRRARQRWSSCTGGGARGSGTRGDRPVACQGLVRRRAVRSRDEARGLGSCAAACAAPKPGGGARRAARSAARRRERPALEGKRAGGSGCRQQAAGRRSASRRHSKMHHQLDTVWHKESEETAHRSGGRACPVQLHSRQWWLRGRVRCGCEVDPAGAGRRRVRERVGRGARVEERRRDTARRHRIREARREVRARARLVRSGRGRCSR
mmetsp:Transcript_22648/g.58256  ORF Transcript_22648/g.58256 Transcript_22648/m.58256 type:complete len:215 (+) Transcript_22648:409-1053(+)